MIHRSCYLTVLLVWAVCPGANWALADDTAATPPVEPLYRQSPFDLLILNDADATEQRVLPLELPGRQLPTDPQPRDKLAFRRVEDPGTLLEIAWRNLAEVRLFEQMVLDEAQRLVAGGRFDEAFAYFEYLQQHAPKLPDLATAWQQALLAEADARLAGGEPDQALLLLYELHELDLPVQDAADRVQQAVGALCDRYEADRNYVAVARLIDAWRQRMPQHPALPTFDARLLELAQRQLDQAMEQRSAGNIDAAYSAVLSALDLRHDWPPARQVLAELVAAYPRVTVGVELPARRLTSRLDDWASRRVRPLMADSPLELRAVGAEGATFATSGGPVQYDPLQRQINLSFAAAVENEPPEAFVVARRLADAAMHGSPNERPALQRLLAALEVPDDKHLRIVVHRSTLAAISVLAETFAPPDGAQLEQLSGGRFLAARETGLTRFTANRQRVAPTAEPRLVEIVERQYLTPRDALLALRRGEVQVLDRINPWDIDSLADDPDIMVEPYAVPSLHVLLINHRRPLLAQREFRRALVYAIDRQRILDQVVLRNRPRAGCRVISGPFSPGTSLDDPLRYAYDDMIRPRVYDPRLAMTLAAAARARIGTADARPGDADQHDTDPPSLSAGELVLAHPPRELARRACEAIARDLAAAGITVRLQPWSNEVGPPPTDGSADLVYAELVLWEPVNDAAALLGPGGLAATNSPYLFQALQGLAEAANWRVARERFQRLHRLAADEVVVAPLWQLVDHLAYRRSLDGIGQRPLSLYHQVDQWQLRGDLVPPEHLP